MHAEYEPRLAESDALARADWLTANELTGNGVSDAHVAHMLRLRQQLGNDDALARDAAQRLEAHLKSVGNDAKQLCHVIADLTEAVFDLVDGTPFVRPDALATRLTRVLDTHALASLHPDVELPPGERFQWWTTAPPHVNAVGPILADGSFDTHVHLAGAVPPAYSWMALMSGEASLSLARRVFDARSGDGSWEAWAGRLAHAQRLRYALARHVLRHERGRFPLLPPCDHTAWSLTDPNGRAVFDLDSEAGLPLEALGNWLSRWQPLERTEGQPYRDLLRQHEHAPCTTGFLDGDAHLLHACARWLRDAAAHDSANALARALLTYLRVRNAFHAVFVREGDGPGLAGFQRAARRHNLLAQGRTSARAARQRWRRFRRDVTRFDRARAAWAVEAQVAHAFAEGTRGAGRAHVTRGVEWRIAPVEGSGFLRRVQAIVDGWRLAIEAHKGADWRFGLVVHLKRESRREREVPRPASQRGTSQAAHAAAEALVHLLREHPGLREIIVGVDVAGAERGSSPRTFAAAFRCLRAAQRCLRPRPGEAPLRLGFTCHAGEDAGDLLTGLRYIDEAATLLLPDERGRIGHALALADDPVRYYAADRHREPRRTARLLDLVWAWGRARGAGLRAEGWLRAAAEHLLVHLQVSDGARAVRAPFERLEECWRAMALDRTRAEGRRRCDGHPDHGAAVVLEQDLLEGLGVDPNDTLVTDLDLTPRWHRLLARLQKVVRARLAHRGVCIEVNPTSNLLVGHYHDFRQLPYRALVDAGLRVSINTDDPGVFGTTLPAEFARLHRAMARSAARRVDVEAWLRARVEDARRTTFLPPSDHDGAFLELLERDDLLAARPQFLP